MFHRSSALKINHKKNHFAVYCKIMKSTTVQYHIAKFSDLT